MTGIDKASGFGAPDAARRSQVTPPLIRQSLDVLQRDWTFRPSTPSLGARVRRLRALRSLARAPASQEMIAVRPTPAWHCYFIYLPTGELTAAHRYTLSRLRNGEHRVLVVCAAPTPAHVPAGLSDLVDALWWKALSGFDFSAYRVGLSALATGSPGADVIVLNDSVLGPFAPLAPLLIDTPWRLTGLTGYSLIENHLQSYTFGLKGVDAAVLRALDDVLFRRLAFNRYDGAVWLQETRLARVAARSMSVGARWFAQAPAAGDPTLCAGPALVREQGFPFLKRSLLTRHTNLYPSAELADLLERHDHPPAELGR